MLQKNLLLRFDTLLLAATAKVLLWKEAAGEQAVERCERYLLVILTCPCTVSTKQVR